MCDERFDGGPGSGQTDVRLRERRARVQGGRYCEVETGSVGSGYRVKLGFPTVLSCATLTRRTGPSIAILWWLVACALSDVSASTHSPRHAYTHVHKLDSTSTRLTRVEDTLSVPCTRCNSFSRLRFSIAWLPTGGMLSLIHSHTSHDSHSDTFTREEWATVQARACRPGWSVSPLLGARFARAPQQRRVARARAAEHR